MSETTETKELDSFVETFTAGLEPDPNQISDEPSATQDPPKPGETDNQDSDTKVDSPDSPKPEDQTQNQQDQTQKDASPDNVPKEDDKKEVNVEEIFTKSDKAFAELRVTNKTQGDLLLRMSRLANLDAKNPAEAIERLSEQLDKIEAKHGNLTYNEVEKIRQSDKEQAAQKAQLQEQAQAGFNQLKAMYKLSDNDIYNFAEALKTQGVNPFETPVDLVAQYRNINYDKLISAAIEEGKKLGRDEEVARRAKAQKQSTTPIQRQGGTETGESLNSTEKLRAFLEN